MPELPDLLRRRLAVAENDTSMMHPDADTITAFVEQSLPMAERQTVVAHLSVCEPCREVVSLSQPLLSELETQTVLAPAPVSKWRRLLTPSFSIAAAVAAMAVIAVLVLQLPQRNTPQSSPEAKASAPANEKTAAEVKEPAIAQPTETRSTASLMDQAGPAKQSQEKDKEDRLKENKARTRRDESADSKIPARLAAAAPAASAPVLTASLKKDYVNTNFFVANETVAVDSQADKDIPLGPQPQPSSANTGFISSKNKLPAFADIPPNTTGKPEVHLLTPAPPPQHFGCTVCKIVTAGAHSLRTITPTIRAGAVSDSAMGAPGMFSSTLQRSPSAEVAAAPAKAEGGSLAASDALSGGALATSNFRARGESAATLWKVAGGKLIKSSTPSQWEDAYPVGSFEFSCVNARG
ncbi:MAG TPA: hypothetical protein VFF39_10040, partial [Verrucomicrobiae bacterium]|nr:hypothetical protein [Verrucomicrobiae bacterium]